MICFKLIKIQTRSGADARPNNFIEYHTNHLNSNKNKQLARLKHTIAGFAHLHKWVWPHAFVGVFMILAGASNIIYGLRAQQFFKIFTGQMPHFQEQVSLGMLGHGTQAILGIGLILTGIGLFWRMRVAWAFAILMLSITIIINIVSSHFGFSLILPCIILIILIIYQRQFSKRTLFGSTFISIIGVLIVVIYGTLGIYLLGQQFDPPIKTMLTALYFLVETLSTTGYGDFHPVSPLAQGFMISLWVFGLGVFGAALASTAGPILSGHLNRFLNPGDAIKMYKDHVIVIGNGPFVGNTIEELNKRNIEYVQVLDAQPEQPGKSENAIYGDYSEDKTLHKAGIEHAAMLIAADNDDGENAFATLAAKDINPSIKVLAVAASKKSIRRLKLAGANTVFAPTEVGSRLIVNLVEGENLPEQFEDLIKRNSE